MRFHKLTQLAITGLALGVLTLMASCGGGSSAVVDTVGGAGNNSGTGTGSGSTGTATCYSGSVANAVGADDPLAANAWQLKNTGPNQIVSAAVNYAVAGIDANVESVHKLGKGCTGRGVTVAIVDSGLEIGHEDLLDNVLVGKSWSFANNTSDPSPPQNQSESDHGTAVAGVAAARGWNGKGTRGTAPNASLLGFPLISGETPAAGTTREDMTYLSFGARALADATRSVVSQFGNRADVAAIFNFSAGSDYAAPTTVSDFSPTELAARYGTGSLRSGLGAVYLQAAGNEFTSMARGNLPDGTTVAVDCPPLLESDAALLGGELSNPAGMTCGSPNHEPSGKPYFIQVAAIHNTGIASSYSSAGAANWITGFGGESGVAEAAMVSTDNSSCASGSNNLANKDALLARIGAVISRLVADLFGAANSNDPGCNYTGRFNGTSAAAPSVAGVVALMLEANPQLTWQDVAFILARTARKVDTGIAAGANRVTYFPSGGSGAWNIEDPWITNAAGFNFQNRYGFGLVDADAAVRLALAYSAPTGRRVSALVAKGGSSGSRRIDTVGLNVATVQFAATGISGPMRLDLTLTNTTGVDINPGMLQFLVENTVTGTKSIVMPAFTAWYAGGKQFPLKSGASQQFRFHTNAFYGESVAGSYKVYVLDFSGASGTADKALAFAPTLTSFSQ